MPVEVVTVETGAEAARALSDRGAYLLGGGTGLMRRIHEGDTRITRLVRVADPAMRGVSVQGGALRIGAQATMADILASREASVLHDAAACVGAAAVRNMASVGGNLFAPAPYGDLAVALLALGAEVELSGGVSGGRVPLERLYSRSDRPMVMAVHVPRGGETGFRFHKMTRTHPRGASVVTVAAAAKLSGGRIEEARIAYGGLAAHPVRAEAAERAARGARLDEAGLAGIAARATEGIEARGDAIASAWYRREMAALHLRKLLERTG